MCREKCPEMPISSTFIKHEALRLGFHACGMARAEAVSSVRQAEYSRWLADGCHAGMDYLANHVEKKADPRLLVEGARTVVSLAVNYYSLLPGEEVKNVDEGGKPALSIGEKGNNVWHIGRYALGTDYHEVVKRMLRQLMLAIGLEEGVDGRCFVDTAPVDEKYWAVQCGLGWRGKNCQLIQPHAGSYFFLGELILTCDVDEYDSPMALHCGSCCKCLEACPAGALKGDGTMDARKCLSYLTIEHRGPLPDGTGRLMGNCFYGCERCAAVCPWNSRFASSTPIEDLKPRAAILEMTPDDWRHLTVEQYQQLFRKSAVKRAKYEGLVRNIQALDEGGN